MLIFSSWFLERKEKKKEKDQEKDSKNSQELQPCAELRAIASRECKRSHAVAWSAVDTGPSSQTAGTAHGMVDSNSTAPTSSHLPLPSCDLGQLTFASLGFSFSSVKRGEITTQTSEGLKRVNQLMFQKATAGVGGADIQQCYPEVPWFCRTNVLNLSQICPSPLPIARPYFNLDKHQSTL